MSHSIIIKTISFLISILLLFCVLCLKGVSQTNASESSESSYPQRIVVFPLFAEEILLDLIGPERIVYVGHRYIEEGVDYSPTMELTRLIPGKEWQNTDEDEIIDLQPDLIILNEDLEEAYVRGVLYPELKKTNASIIFIKQPRSIKDIEENILLLGAATGAPTAASAMVYHLENGIKKCLDSFARFDGTTPVKVLYYNSYQKSFPIIAQLCMFDCLYYDDYVSIDDYQISEWNPDFIFFNPAWVDTDGTLIHLNDPFAIAKNITSNTLLSDTKAVRNCNVYPLYLHSSHYIIKNIEEIILYLQALCVDEGN